MIFSVIVILWLTYNYYWQNKGQDENLDHVDLDDKDEATLIDQFFSLTIDEFQNQRHGDHPEPESDDGLEEPDGNLEPYIDSESMIGNIQNQRHGDHAKYQFAVMFVSEDEKLIHLSKNKHKTTSHDRKLTDCKCKIYPPDEYIDNYITARPNRLVNGATEHAESLLMEKLDLLIEKFGESKCQTIVLYTWLLPCRDCKKQIIRKLAKKKHVILAYTSKMRNENNEYGIVTELESAGIEVRKVEYNQKLQPL